MLPVSLLVLTLLDKVLKEMLFAINAIFTDINTSGLGFKTDPIRYQCYLSLLVLTLLDKVLKETLSMLSSLVLTLQTLFAINAIFTGINTFGQGFKTDPIRYQCYLFAVSINTTRF